MAVIFCFVPRAEHPSQERVTQAQKNDVVAPCAQHRSKELGRIFFADLPERVANMVGMSHTFAFPGLSSPNVGTDSPLQLLSACHTRVNKQLRTLQRLQVHVQQHGPDQQAREAATAILRYFTQAAPLHHADEEQDLFPALLEAMAGSDATCIQDLQTRIHREHRQLEAFWAQLQPTLNALAQGQPRPLPPDEVARFVQAYEAHMAIEDREVMPMAERLLDASTLERMGHHMRQRRQSTA